MKLFNQITKITLYIFWLAFVVNLVLTLPGSTGILYLGLALLAIHALEFVLVFKGLKQAGHASLKDFVWVMLLGLFHWKPILRKAKAA